MSDSLPPSPIRFARLRKMPRPSLKVAWWAASLLTMAAVVFLIAVETFAYPGLIAQSLNKPERVNVDDAESSRPGRDFSKIRDDELNPFSPDDTAELNLRQKPLSLSKGDAAELIVRVQHLATSFAKFKADWKHYAESLDAVNRSTNVDYVADGLWNKLVGQGFTNPRVPKAWYDQVEYGSRYGERISRFVESEFITKRLREVQYRILGEEIKPYDMRFIAMLQSVVDDNQASLDKVGPHLDRLIESLSQEGVWPSERKQGELQFKSLLGR